MSSPPIRAAILAISALATASCALPGAGEPPQLYTLTPKSTFDASLPRVDWQLVVERPVASAGREEAGR